jgi:hypothetical protein
MTLEECTEVRFQVRAVTTSVWIAKVLGHTSGDWAKCVVTVAALNAPEESEVSVESLNPAARPVRRTGDGRFFDAHDVTSKWYPKRQSATDTGARFIWEELDPPLGRSD